ncbi:MAG: RHS repeat-associated core domain-containing protein [Myxococcales bacterium]|nr:RHS repeat-associated core domain-containing protein [Myxococcales bacterium]
MKAQRSCLGSRTVTEPDRGASQTFEYDNVTLDYDLWDFPFAGLVKRHTLEERTATARSLRTTTSYTWKTVRHSSARAHFPYVAKVVSLREELAGATKTELSKASHTISVDAFHNIRRITSAFGDGESETQDAQYEHDTTPTFSDSWLVSLPSEVTHKGNASGVVQSSQTRRWKLHHVASGALESITSEPDDPGLRQETLFVRDAFGNPIKIRQHSKTKTRQRTIAYEGRGVFPRVVIDEEGYKTEVDFHHGHGVPVRVREHGTLGQPNGALEHLSVSDGFGRPRLMLGPDGTEVRRSYEPVSGPYNPMLVTTEVPGWARSVVRIDPLGRQAGETFSTFNGVELDYFQRYDVYGRPFDVVRPTSGSSTVKTKFEHDDAGRLLAITHPDATKQVYCYRGNVSCTKDARGYVRCAQRDGRGRIRRVSDPMPSDTARGCESVAEALASGAEQRPGVRYGFGPHGLLDRVDDTQGNTTFIGRDVLGRVTLRYDPGTGVRSFSFGAFGNLKSETDARGVTTSYGHDLLDRTTIRTDPAGSTHFSWSSTLHGALSSSSTADGVQASLAYDSSGRLQSETRTIGNVVLHASIEARDQYSRPTIVAYPSTSGQPALRVRYTYDAYGNAVEVGNADSGEVYWKLGAIDEFGQVTEEKLGAALTTKRKYDKPFGRIELEETAAASAIHTRKYTYDEIGNVRTTGAPQASKQLTFEYDELNRLTKETSAVSVGYQYSPGGNLLDKPGVGAYSYTLALQPHAVAAVTGGASTQAYGYDAAGNMTSRTGAPLAPLTFEYTSFDKPFRVFSASPADGTELGYDSDQVRARKQRPGESTAYFPAMYAGTTGPGGVDERFWIYAGGGPVAEVIRDSSGERLTYLLSDRLGSIEAIADPQGAVLERRTFDSFGQKQVLATAAGYVPTRLGFGGHESDDEHGLVNMGGRIYDPRLGRFTSADPLVPTADSQGWNRYSFVLNNPATLTDPSGFDPACDNLSPLCSGYGGPSHGGGDGGEAVSDIIRMNTVSVYHSGFAGTDASNLAAAPPNGTLPGFGDMIIVGIVEPLGSVQSAPLFEPGPIVPTPGAAWFGIDALNNPDGNWPRRGGAVPYATMDPDIMIPGLRAVLDPRASASERILGGVMLGMTALPAAGVAIRWVAVAVRASGALRAAGVVTRGGTVFWRGVAGGAVQSTGPLKNLGGAVDEVAQVARTYQPGTVIQFGRTANQTSHAFRHTDALGLSRSAVMQAIEQQLPGVASRIPAGRPLNQVIQVGGQQIQYSAFRLPNGVINVGRIHGVP